MSPVIHGPGPGNSPSRVDSVEILRDDATGLWAAIAVDREVRGVAAGGIRIKPYDRDDDAVADARALARAMTLKGALAGVPSGGAKVVVRADRLRDRAGALEQLGRAVESRAGHLYVGPDFGFTDADRDAVARGTRYIDAPEVAEGMAMATALGVRACIGAALGVTLESDAIRGTPLAGRRIGIEGLGHVGAALAGLLLRDGAEVFGAEIDPDRIAAAARLGVQVIDGPTLWRTPLDVLAPCALGGAIDRSIVDRLACHAIIGAANNLLVPPDDEIAAALAARRILYVPDFLANAGALVLWSELVLAHRTRADAMAAVVRIGDTARLVMARATDEGSTPLAVARRLAAERLAELA